DIDVLARLREVTRLGVSVSVPLWDPEHARAMEPFVATPQRRIKTIARLAAAGVDGYVNVGPMIPGVGGGGIGESLTAAGGGGGEAGGLHLPAPAGAGGDGVSGAVARGAAAAGRADSVAGARSAKGQAKRLALWQKATRRGAVCGVGAGAVRCHLPAARLE